MNHAEKIEAHFGQFDEETRECFTEEKVNLIAFTNRSGSTLLTHLFKAANLGGREGDDDNFEYFNFDNLLPYAKRNGLRDFKSYYDWAITRNRGPLGYSTVKVSAEQLTLVLSRYVSPRPRSVRVFLIRRRDLIAQATSLSVALQTGQWTSNRPSNGDVSYDPNLIGECVKMIQRAEERIHETMRKYKVNPLYYIYEDIQNNFSGTISSLRKDIGLPQIEFDPPEIPIKKQRTSITEEFAMRYVEEHPNVQKLLSRNI